MAVHATDDSATFLETDAISGNLLSNDSSDNGHLFLRAFDGASVGAKSGNSQITEIQGDYGTFFVKPDGSYTYVLSDAAKVNFTNGELLQEKVSYKISDGSGHTDVGLFTLNIQGVTQVKPIDGRRPLQLHRRRRHRWQRLGQRHCRRQWSSLPPTVRHHDRKRRPERNHRCRRHVWYVPCQGRWNIHL